MDYLIEEFIERYLSRAEIIHRLPVSRPISSFWPALQEARRARATEFTLKDQAVLVCTQSEHRAAVRRHSRACTPGRAV